MPSWKNFFEHRTDEKAAVLRGCRFLFAAGAPEKTESGAFPLLFAEREKSSSRDKNILEPFRLQLAGFPLDINPNSDYNADNPNSY